MLDKRIPLPRREEVIPGGLVKHERCRDPERRVGVFERVPADPVHAAHQNGADVEPGAAVHIQAGAAEQIRAVRAHRRPVHATLDKDFGQQIRADVLHCVVRRVRQVVEDPDRPARVDAHPADDVALAPVNTMSKFARPRRNQK